MGRPGAFLHVARKQHEVRPAAEAVRDFDELAIGLAIDEQREQASRCMNCGVAFCQCGGTFEEHMHTSGCPLHNHIPEVNDLLYQGRMDEAYARLLLTNPFPEFTGRVCPAPCETACNLGLHDEPVTIHDNERLLSDLAWERGVKPLRKPADDAPLVSVIGAGPAGLAVAWELARLGKRVVVYDKAPSPGGLLAHGIPSMKLPKCVVARRIALMEQGGIEFACGVDAAACAGDILANSSAVVIATGAQIPRDVALDGRELGGIHFALEYLPEAVAAHEQGRAPVIDAAGKDVVVLGGGDTGVDCVACALRQGAKSITQVIRAPRPAASCDVAGIWPAPRKVYEQGYGQREVEEVLGADPRIWSTDTIGFIGEASVEAVRVQELSYDGGRHLVEGTLRDIPAQLVLVAKGFLGADGALFEAFGVGMPQQGDASHLVSAAGEEVPVFAAGDARLGATLVSSAIADGLACARAVEETLCP